MVLDDNRLAFERAAHPKSAILSRPWRKGKFASYQINA
jgi:hypothetical protein